MLLRELIGFDKFTGKTAAECVEQLRALVLCLDGSQCPYWMSLGFPSEPTEEDVVRARAEREAFIEVQQFSEEIWSPLISSGATKEQLKSAVAGW
jgi:hypothetical protein